MQRIHTDGIALLLELLSPIAGSALYARIRIDIDNGRMWVRKRIREARGDLAPARIQFHRGGCKTLEVLGIRFAQRGWPRSVVRTPSFSVPLHSKALLQTKLPKLGPGQETRRREGQSDVLPSREM